MRIKVRNLERVRPRLRFCVLSYSMAQYVYSLSAEQFSDYTKTQSRTNASEIAHFVVCAHRVARPSHDDTLFHKYMTQL